MQYQKEEIRERILAAGKCEYLEKGYKGGRISVIAENADVPVGNLYRYFDGKSGVFDAIVHSVYVEVPLYVEQLAEDSRAKNLTLNDVAEVLTSSILELLDRCGTEMIILMDKSEGSRYNDFGDKLQAVVYRYVDIAIFRCKTEEDEIFCSVVAKSFLGMIFDILRKGDKGNYGRLLKKLLVYTFFESRSRLAAASQIEGN